MITKDVPLGHCPRCGASVPWDRLLIEYERQSGEHAVFAECPACTGVVVPE